MIQLNSIQTMIETYFTRIFPGLGIEHIVEYVQMFDGRIMHIAGNQSKSLFDNHAGLA